MTEKDVKCYISFGLSLWDKKTAALLTKLKEKTNAEYLLCGANRANKEMCALINEELSGVVIFSHENSPAFLCEMYRYWNQPEEDLCFDWYLPCKTEISLQPEELITCSNDFLLTNDLSDIRNAIVAVSIVEYNNFAVVVKDYQGIFPEIIEELSEIFEGENQFTEYKREYIKYI